MKYLSRTRSSEQLAILQKILKNMEFPVFVQDIMMLSALRRDGHPSVYVRGTGEKNNQLLKDHGSDCSHWCLPGVPDTWNEILNVML